MFCPSCRDEFRPGFTRCANCDVDLVESLEAAPQSPPPSASTSGSTSTSASAPRPTVGRPMRDTVGFVSLDDAREHRDRLRDEGILSEIVIRESPQSSPDGPVEEEYWLRVEVAGLPRAMRLLDDGSFETEGPAPFTCDRCGHGVTEADTACPKCGARFDD